MSYFGELSSTRLQVFAGRRLPTATFFLFLVFVLFAFHVLIFWRVPLESPPLVGLPIQV